MIAVLALTAAVAAADAARVGRTIDTAGVALYITCAGVNGSQIRRSSCF